MELTRSIEVPNKHGLHARASAALAGVANEFKKADVRIARGVEEEEVDAKSILAILTLGVAKGELLYIRCSGEDAEKAMHAVVELVENKFGEE